MKDTTKKIIISIIIFILYFSFSYIVEFIVNLFKININSWKHIFVMIFIYSLDLIPFFVLIFIYKNDLKNEFIDFKKKWKDFADKYIKFWIIGIILMSLSNYFISLFTANPIGNNEETVRKIIDILPLYSIITTCISAPIVEELMYRKNLKNIFNKKWLSIIASGLIFGIAHVLGTYETVTDILYLIPYGILGSIFMYIYIDSKNIWSTISIHFIHNTLLLTIYLISTHL